jgi:hypothetical protein
LTHVETLENGYHPEFLISVNEQICHPARKEIVDIPDSGNQKISNGNQDIVP